MIGTCRDPLMNQKRYAGSFESDKLENITTDLVDHGHSWRTGTE